MSNLRPIWRINWSCVNNIFSRTCINHTYAVVSIAKPTDPCFSVELEVPEEQSKDIIIAGIIGMISNFATGSLSSLFYHCYQIWYKDCLKYENRMRLVGTPFVPPPPHHHHWHYFDITKLPYQKQYPRHLLQKPPKVKVSLLSWWSSTIFRLNMTESWILFVNWQGVYDECPSYDGFSSYDVCLAHQMVKS